jgi:hypothetical protein
VTKVLSCASDSDWKESSVLVDTDTDLSVVSLTDLGRFGYDLNNFNGE